LKNLTKQFGLASLERAAKRNPAVEAKLLVDCEDWRSRKDLMQENSFLPYLLVAIGGALGATARYALSTSINDATTTTFPWGTLTVNLLGCFFLGLITTLIADRVGAGSEVWKMAACVGFLGSFTTFSTFALEKHELFASGSWLAGGLYLSLSIMLGIAAIQLGFFAAGWLGR
jgi:CrcB protein